MVFQWALNNHKVVWISFFILFCLHIFVGGSSDASEGSGLTKMTNASGARSLEASVLDVSTLSKPFVFPTGG